MYTSGEVAKIYGVVTETVRNWTMEFAEYLSLSAHPGRNKKRTYSLEDMRVLSMVAAMKERNMTNEDIHATLKSGQRGELPDLSPDDVKMIALGDQEKRLAVQVDQLERTIVQLKKDLALSQEQASQAQQYKEANIKLTTSLDHVQKDLEEAKARVQRLENTHDEAVKDLNKRIEELARQLGQEYARGVMDTLRERGDLPRRETDNGR